MEKRGKLRLDRFWKEWLRPILVVILLTSSFRSAVADWNDVPTGSMKPTILEGDRIFINKIGYYLKSPFTRIRLAQWDDPTRGEVVVLFSPYDGRRLVKRVVGLPGNVIEMRNDRLFVNGNAVLYTPLDPQFIREITQEDQTIYDFSSEDLSGRKHPVMIAGSRPALRSFQPFVVPADQYFVMGDNRDNSFDSRYFGPVERKQIVGRAVAVVASL